VLLPLHPHRLCRWTNAPGFVLGAFFCVCVQKVLASWQAVSMLYYMAERPSNAGGGGVATEDELAELERLDAAYKEKYERWSAASYAAAEAESEMDDALYLWSNLDHRIHPEKYKPKTEFERQCREAAATTAQSLLDSDFFKRALAGIGIVGDSYYKTQKANGEEA
jgi:hypothetical protein